MSFDAPPIDTTLPLSKELQRLGLTHARRALSALSRGDIHEARRAIKRLRAALRLAKDDPTALKTDKALRDIGRMLSASRDLEVSRQLLPSFTSHLSTREEEQLNALLEPTNQHDTAIGRALPALEKICRDLHDWQPNADWNRLGNAIAHTYKLAVRRLKECRDHAKATRKSAPLSGPLHELRKELKRLTHQLCLLPVESTSSPESSWLERKRAEVRQASQLLGQEHDLHVFQESLGKHARPVLPALKTRQSVLQHEAFECAARFLRKKPSAFCRKLEVHLKEVTRGINHSS